MNALGLIEVIGFPCAIDAADAAAKSASIKLLGITKIGSGMLTVSLCGDVGAIQAAVRAGKQSAQKLGKVLYTHVIPHADAQLPATGVIPSPEAVPQKEASYSKLLNAPQNSLHERSNAELKSLAQSMGLATEKEVKYLKKEELIALIEKGKEQ